MTPPVVELSVIVPVYGCAECLDELRARTAAALDAHGIGHQIVFVNDASRDDAARVLVRLAAADPRVEVISLPVNRGQHAAIAEGLAGSTGRWAAVMDCDLQDPPELLPDMLSMARGADIVVARRGAHAQSRWRRLASAAFGALARRKHGSRLVGTHSVFSVVSRRAVEGYLRRDERMTMYLPVMEALGLKIASFDYDRAPRAAGRSAYTALGLLRRAGRVLAAPRLK